MKWAESSFVTVVKAYITRILWENMAENRYTRGVKSAVQGIVSPYQGRLISLI